METILKENAVVITIANKSNNYNREDREGTKGEGRGKVSGREGHTSSTKGENVGKRKGGGRGRRGDYLQ